MRGLVITTKQRSDEIVVNDGLQDFLLEFLDERGISHSRGKVWTTDGITETAEKLLRRKEAGAICVDMECSAVVSFFALAYLSFYNCLPIFLCLLTICQRKNGI